MILEVHVIKNPLLYTKRVTVSTKLGRMVNYINWILFIKPHDILITWPHEIMWYKKTLISLSKHRVYGYFINKLGRMTTYLNGVLPLKLDEPLIRSFWPPYLITSLDRLLPIKSHKSFISWCCKITWQIRTLISQLPQYLWLLRRVGWRFNLGSSEPKSHITPWPCGLEKVTWQTKTIYLYCQSAFGHQHWEKRNLS